MSSELPRTRKLVGKWLGRRPYEPIVELQHALHDARQKGAIGDTVLVLEHEPVITSGRGAKAAHLLATQEQLSSRGVRVVETGRGGDVTLHAPGQLVCYPIIDLSPDRRDVRRYVNDLATVMASLTASVGVASGLVDKLIGVWVDRNLPGEWRGAAHAGELAKIGAIGVRISRWITMHGFALNVSTDMSFFKLIVPCGIREHGVTSIEQLTGNRLPLQPLATAAVRALGEVLDAQVEGVEDCASSDLRDIWPQI